MEYEENLPSNAEVKEIADLAQIQISRQKRVEELEGSLKSANEALRKVQEVDLPAAMQQAGVSEIKLPNGMKISIKAGFSASVPKDRKQEVCQWLRSNGFGDIVSEDVVVTFGRGEEELAAVAAKRLVEMGYQPTLTTDVNTARLKSLISEQVAKGKDIPLEFLGAVQWTKSIIK
jgi:hypothetical protein